MRGHARVLQPSLGACDFNGSAHVTVYWLGLGISLRWFDWVKQV